MLQTHESSTAENPKRGRMVPLSWKRHRLTYRYHPACSSLTSTVSCPTRYIATPRKFPESVPDSRMVCAGVWDRRIPGATFVPSAWIQLSSKSQSRKGPQALLLYCTLRIGAWAWKSTSLPRYLTFWSSTPDALVPEDADGLITRKLQSGLPSAWGIVTWNWPARPLGVAAWFALRKPQVAAAATAPSGALSWNRAAVRWIMFAPTISWRPPRSLGRSPTASVRSRRPSGSSASIRGGMGR